MLRYAKLNYAKLSVPWVTLAFFALYLICLSGVTSSVTMRQEDVVGGQMLMIWWAKCGCCPAGPIGNNENKRQTVLRSRPAQPPSCSGLVSEPSPFTPTVDDAHVTKHKQIQHLSPEHKGRLDEVGWGWMRYWSVNQPTDSLATQLIRLSRLMRQREPSDRPVVNTVIQTCTSAQRNPSVSMETLRPDANKGQSY